MKDLFFEEFELAYEVPTLPVVSAWAGLERYIKPIMHTFNVGNDLAIEFGVQYGYSLSALMNYFAETVGVDTFAGDEHAGGNADPEALWAQVYQQVQAHKDLTTSDFHLRKQSYQEFFLDDWHTQVKPNLVHIDIVHTYEATYECGLLTIQHLQPEVILFHDTESFAEVKRAVQALSDKFGWEFYNIPLHYGLGILVKPNL